MLFNGLEAGLLPQGKILPGKSAVSACKPATSKCLRYCCLLDINARYHIYVIRYSCSKIEHLTSSVSHSCLFPLHSDSRETACHIVEHLDSHSTLIRHWVFTGRPLPVYLCRPGLSLGSPHCQLLHVTFCLQEDCLSKWNCKNNLVEIMEYAIMSTVNCNDR